MVKAFTTSINLFRFQIPEKHRLPFAVILSVLLHLLFILTSELGIIPLGSDTIVMPGELEEENQMVFEIVESNPEAEIENLPDDLRFASDRNTRAQDLNEQNDAEADRPMTEEAFDSKELPSPPENEVRQEYSQDQTPFRKFERPETGMLAAEPQEENDNNDEDKSHIISGEDKQAIPDNELMSANDLGGFSLSTYAWDFAPYMLELKKRVERNINPPSAFYMGLIEGTYIIQFVVDRAGTVLDIRVMDSRGNKALEETSYNAIKYSNPFRPLPNDFPDEVLTITGTFRFKNMR